VSVRSAAEAITALQGGAPVIDIKEPERGPLGRADVAVWQAVRRVVPPNVELSVALGELNDWDDRPPLHADDFAGIGYRKLGLAHATKDWSRAWSSLRRASGVGPSWVAVVYADWARAGAPHPDLVLDEALAINDCTAVLVDTWSKTEPSPLDESWSPWVARARAAGKKIVLAGGLNAAAITRLAPLRPDLFAVRGAACRGGDRHSTVDVELVARLVHVVESL